MKKLFAAAGVMVFVGIAGCSTPGKAGPASSGVILQPDGTYTSSGSTYRTSTSSERILNERIRDAKNFCELTNKKFRLIKETHEDSHVSGGMDTAPYAIIYFACD